MKGTTIILTALAALAWTGCTETDGIGLTFNVTDPVSKTVVVVCHTDINEVPLDSLGHGTCKIDGIDAAYMRIYYGQEMKRIYAENGDRATISFTGNDFSGSFRFEGKKAPAVEYLNTIELTAMPDESYALPFDEFLSRTKEKTDEALALLHARDLKGTGDFVRMEEGRITYSYGTPLLMYPMAHRIMAKDPQYVPDEKYYDAIRGYSVENPLYADMDEYRDFMTESAHVLDEDNRDVIGLYPKLVAEMRYIAAGYTDEKVRQALLHHIAAPYIDNFGTDNVQDMTNIYRTYVSDPRLVSDFDAKCDKWDRKKPGKQSPDFKAVGIDGREYTLADFRGRYLYIDIWATWCRPCLRELPHLKKLETDFADKNITFLGLSIDSDKAKWEDKVRSGEMTGTQLYLGNESDFLTAYGIAGIPRFILLDMDGKIINPEMTRPSSPDTADFLSTLEGL